LGRIAAKGTGKKNGTGGAKGIKLAFPRGIDKGIEQAVEKGIGL
jgi:hypothetical protein